VAQRTVITESEESMPYRMQDDSVTVRGKGHPELAGKTVTRQGNEMRIKDGAEPGRFEVGKRGHSEREGGKSTARDVTSVRPKGQEPILPKKMPNLR
jgi:hypothetical protein